MKLSFEFDDRNEGDKSIISKLIECIRITTKPKSLIIPSSSKDELDKAKKTEQDYAEKLKEDRSKYIELQIKTTNEREELEQEIKRLKEKIEIYEPYIGGSSGEVLYYDIEDNVLTQTIDRKAPYIGKLSDGGFYHFQFNKDKGPVIQACKDRENMLIPFCTITEETPDANSIEWIEWGKAKSTAANTLKVETKAKIKLIKVKA